MRRIPGLSIALAMAAGMVGFAMPAMAQQAILVEERAPRPARRTAKRSYLSTAPVRYRSRWKPTKPKRRPNRLHISRRVRRKHRRAA